MTEATKKPFGTFVLHDLYNRVAKVTDWATGCPGKTTPLRLGAWPLTEERPFTDLVLFGLSELYYVVTSDDGEVTEVTALPVRPDNVIVTEHGKFRLEALLREEPDYLHRLSEAIPVPRFDKEDRLLPPDGYVVLNTSRVAKASPYLFKAGSAYGLYRDKLVLPSVEQEVVESAQADGALKSLDVSRLKTRLKNLSSLALHLDWDKLPVSEEKPEAHPTPKEGQP